MIEQLETFNNNTLAFEVIDGFTETDTKFAQKIFNEKIGQGFDRINLLIKMDELKVSNINAKAFFEDALFTLRNYKNLGHIAIVAHSKIVKALVPIDNLFFQRAREGREERYFDVAQMDAAWEFVGAKKK